MSKELPTFQKTLEGVRERILQFIEGEPDAFCILAGPSRLHEARGYVASSFAVGDENSRLAIKSGRINFNQLGLHLNQEEIDKVKERGVPAGGNDRIVAAAKLYEIFPEAKFVTVTRPRSEDEPTYATIIEEGLSRRNVPEENILSEGKNATAVDTISEYREYIRLWKQHGWKNMAFILSKWHVPRAKALLNHIEDFTSNDPEDQQGLVREFVEAIRTGDLNVQFVDTSNTLSAFSDKFKYFFENLLTNDPGMRLREAMEASAIEQIKAGTYGGVQLSRKIWHDQP